MLVGGLVMNLGTLVYYKYANPHSAGASACAGPSPKGSGFGRDPHYLAAELGDPSPTR